MCWLILMLFKKFLLLFLLTKKKIQLVSLLAQYLRGCKSQKYKRICMDHYYRQDKTPLDRYSSRPKIINTNYCSNMIIWLSNNSYNATRLFLLLWFLSLSFPFLYLLFQNSFLCQGNSFFTSLAFLRKCKLFSRVTVKFATQQIHCLNYQPQTWQGKTNQKKSLLVLSPIFFLFNTRKSVGIFKQTSHRYTCPLHLHKQEPVTLILFFCQD